MPRITRHGWTKRLAGLLLGGLASAPVAAGAAAYSYTQPLLPRATARNTGLHTLWQIPIGLTPADRDRVLHLARVGSLVFVLTARGYLVGINAADGTIRGSTKVPGEGDLVKGIVRFGRHQVLLTALGELLDMNTRTGKMVHRQVLKFAPGTAPLVTPAGIFIGDLAGQMHALSAKFPLYGQWFQEAAGDSFQTNPVLAGRRSRRLDKASGRLVFVSRQGVLWGRDPADGQGGWRRRLGGRVTVGGLTAGDGLVFVPCLDHKLYAIDPESGMAPWIIHLPGRLDHRPRVCGKKLLIASGGAGLFCLAAASGRRLWGPVRGVGDVIARNGSTLVAVTQRGDLALLNLKNGATVGAAPLRGAALFAENPYQKNSFYVAAWDGRVAALILRPEF